MSDNGEYTAYAVSRDGYNYQDINEGKAIFDPKEHARIEGGTRDAYITRAHDGKGYLMVTTDMCVAKSHKWDNYGIDLLKSEDLIHWSALLSTIVKAWRIFVMLLQPSRLIRIGAPSIECGHRKYFGILTMCGRMANVVGI